MRAVAEDLWVLDEPEHRMFGIELGTRATVVRLRSGGLLIHSPVPLTEARREAVEQLGGVEHIVAPALYHHLFVGQWAQAYPDAVVHGVTGLAKKRPDLKFHHDLGETPDTAWADVLDQHCVPSMLGETVFYHRPSQTLIVSDLFENFGGSDHWPTRTYLKIAGIHGRPGVSRMLRPMYRDRRAARASLDQILDWTFDRAIVAHGDLVEENARAALLTSFEWMRVKG